MFSPWRQEQSWPWVDKNYFLVCSVSGTLWSLFSRLIWDYGKPFSPPHLRHSEEITRGLTICRLQHDIWGLALFIGQAFDIENVLYCCKKKQKTFGVRSLSYKTNPVTQHRDACRKGYDIVLLNTRRLCILNECTLKTKGHIVFICAVLNEQSIKNFPLQVIYWERKRNTKTLIGFLRFPVHI